MGIYASGNLRRTPEFGFSTKLSGTGLNTTSRMKQKLRQKQRALGLAMLKDDIGLITTSDAGSTKFNILHSSHWAV
jgi:hypothetical protein